MDPTAIFNEIKFHLVLVNSNFLIKDMNEFSPSICVQIILHQEHIDVLIGSVSVLDQASSELDIPQTNLIGSVSPESILIVGDYIVHCPFVKVVVDRRFHLAIPLDNHTISSLEQDAS